MATEPTADVRSEPGIAAVAALASDPTRARMLAELLGGKALTAGELARAASVTPQTCSGHLAKLTRGGFIEPIPQGRHRYYRLANSDVAALLESLQVLAAVPAHGVVTGPKDQKLRDARVCYDHLAGALGVALFARLTDKKWISNGAAGLSLTDAGRHGLTKMGVMLPSPSGGTQCRECMDWSERRMHLAGPVGRQLLVAMLDHGWLQRRRGSRSLRVTPGGRVALQDALQLFDAAGVA